MVEQTGEDLGEGLNTAPHFSDKSYATAAVCADRDMSVYKVRVPLVCGDRSARLTHALEKIIVRSLCA